EGAELPGLYSLYHERFPMRNSVRAVRLRTSAIEYRASATLSPGFLNEPLCFFEKFLIVPDPDMAASVVADEARASNVVSRVASSVVGSVSVVLHTDDEGRRLDF